MTGANQTEKRVIMDVRHLKKYFPVQKSRIMIRPKSVKAVDDVSFSVYENETFSLVGESGCGKSTTGRCLAGMIGVTSGEACYQGRNIADMTREEKRRLTGELQMIFQDPYSSLNPRMTIGRILEEPLIIHGVCSTKKERVLRVLDILKKVGMRADHYYRYPHEFSGGQRQRIGIARALILNPRLIVCDEPVSALDVSIQSQILNLLVDIKKSMNMTYVFISHNMSVVRYISDRVGVMYLGHLVELAPVEDLYGNPLHPYTKALLSAVPEANPHVKKEQIILEGDLPSPLNPPSGCVFHNRCQEADAACGDARPRMEEISPGHFVSCFRHGPYCGGSADEIAKKEFMGSLQ